MVDIRRRRLTLAALVAVFFFTRKILRLSKAGKDCPAKKFLLWLLIFITVREYLQRILGGFVNQR
jgi:hypothetical protein